MRRSLLSTTMATLVALVVLAWPAHAQLFPSPPSGEPKPAAPNETPPERVLIDTTFWIMPPADQQACMQLDPGRLRVTTRLTGENEPRPTTLRLLSFRGFDPDGDLRLAVGRDESSTEVLLTGGIYCWTINTVAPVHETSNTIQRSPYIQLVSLRMTLQQ